MASRASRPQADRGTPSWRGQGEAMTCARLRATNNSGTARHPRTQATQLQRCTTCMHTQCEA
eukprot:14003912-Alexandrium_andersonii.AAC.1